MNDMMGGFVDVTKYINSGEYKPEYCEGRLDKLIKVIPRELDRNLEARLQEKLNDWKNEHNKNLDVIDFNINNIAKNTKYQYSYAVAYDIYDVYQTEINGIKNFKLFIRLDKNGDIINGYNDSGWVINSCGN